MRLMPFLLLLFSYPFLTFAQNYDVNPSSLWKNCGRKGFACGECETKLQEEVNDYLKTLTGVDVSNPKSTHWGELAKWDKPLAIKKEFTLVSALKGFAQLIRRHNTQGGNYLNWVVIGKSESKQDTRIGFPRIALKSAESELWVTFNTDPFSKFYQTLEVLRWNGKRGVYEFHELNFAATDSLDTRAYTLDTEGTSCLECHSKELPGPIMDTYRAWAGFVPPRDDMLESTPKISSAKGLTALQARTAQMDGNAMAYFEVLEKILLARDKIKNDPDFKNAAGEDLRHAYLDIPYDESQKISGMKIPRSAAEYVQSMKDILLTRGYYRIPHYPFPGRYQNNDLKTAPRAGALHIAFDQLSGQRMCQVATHMKRDKNFEAYKYALAGIAFCRVRDFASLRPYLSERFLELAVSTFASGAHFELTGKKLAMDRVSSTSTKAQDAYALVQRHTRESHKANDQFKIFRHTDYLKNFYISRLGASEEDSKRSAAYIASEVKVPQITGFNAVPDPGGVRGVEEGHPQEMAALRFLLTPFGVPVGDWSLSFGENNQDKNYSFSDQLIPLLQGQPILRAIFEGPDVRGSCRKLEERSAFQLLYPPSRTVPITENVPLPRMEAKGILPQDLSLLLHYNTLKDTCTQLVKDMQSKDFVLKAEQIQTMQKRIQPIFQRQMGLCLKCHTEDKSAPLFPGITATKDKVDGSIKEIMVDEDLFKRYLLNASKREFKLGDDMNRKVHNYTMFEYALRPEHYHKTGLGQVMPPKGWEGEGGVMEREIFIGYLRGLIYKDLLEEDKYPIYKQLCQSLMAAFEKERPLVLPEAPKGNIPFKMD